MEAIGVGGDCAYFLGDQSFRLTIRRMDAVSEARRSAGAERGMERYEREVSSTPAGGSNTSGRVCGRVVAGCLTTIDVLTAGEREMGTGNMFIEPQLPMTHLQAIAGEPSVVPGNAANWVQWLTVGDRSAEVGDWRNEHFVSNSLECKSDQLERDSP